MKKTHIIYIAVLSAILFAASGCRPLESVNERLDRAENCMNSDPELSLRTIDSIDSRMLVTRGRRARYCLLKSMALDKNYIDTTDIGIIMPAVEYYRRHGTPTEKMRAYMYLGRIYYNNNQINDAMFSYMIAADFSGNTSDMKSKALLMSSISEAFSFNHNYHKALGYTMKSMDCFKEICDTVNVWYSIGDIALLYSRLLEKEKADTFFREFMTMPIIDSSYYDMIVMDYACDKVLEDEMSEDVIGMCETSMFEFGKELSAHDLCVYALALERKGLSSVADSVLSIAENSNSDSTCIDVWKYRVEKNRCNYKQSLEFLENSLDLQNSVVAKALERSLENVQVDYYKSKSDNLKEQEKIMEIERLILSCLIVIILLVFYIIYIHKKKTYNERIEILSNLKEETESQLSLLKEEAGDKLNRLLDEKTELRFQVSNLKKKYMESYGEKLKDIHNLCVAYLSSGKPSRKNALYAEVKKSISFLENDRQGQLNFEVMLNEAFDGIMDQFRADFSDWKEQDVRFVSYVIAGFETKTIASITGMTPGSVDVKKNRIRTRILSSSNPNKEKFIKVINREWKAI